MTQLVDNIVGICITFLQTYGPPFGFLLVLSESIIPALPLGVFVAFNMIAFGNVLGFIISWSATITGCILSYFLFSKVVDKYFLKKINKKKKYKYLIKRIKNISFSNLVLIIALPFSPAFAINIAAGLSHLEFKKFFTALLIGKLFIIYFWGYIGKSLLESMTDIKTISIIIGMLLFSYIISKVINKRFNID